MLTGARQSRLSSATVGQGTQMLTVIVANIDAHCRKTKEQGATICEELNETIDGERQYGVEDLDGHRWLFSQHARDVNPEAWGAKLAATRL